MSTQSPKEIKPSHLLAAVAWACAGIIGAQIVMRNIPADVISWSMFAIFFFVALMASAVANGHPTVKAGNMRINIAGQIFTGDALTVHNLRDGGTFVYVDLTKPLQKFGEESSYFDGNPDITFINTRKK